MVDDLWCLFLEKVGNSTIKVNIVAAGLRCTVTAMIRDQIYANVRRNSQS
jgi:hypothetical protein